MNSAFKVLQVLLINILSKLLSAAIFLLIQKRPEQSNKKYIFEAKIIGLSLILLTLDGFCVTVIRNGPDRSGTER